MTDATSTVDETTPVDALQDVMDIEDLDLREKIIGLLKERARARGLELEAKEIKDRVKNDLTILMLAIGHPGVEMEDVGSATWRNNGDKVTYKQKDILNYLVMKAGMGAKEAMEAVREMATVTKPKVEESVVFNAWKGNGKKNENQ